MANPKRRHSNTRTRTRRAHDALDVISATRCPQCGAGIRPHRVCESCGYYRGRQVMTIKVREKTPKEK
ncbi:MAG TPA: 50S ribosomal protein L32 [Verrucomicrobiae bacterium]|jgi:large subunit ribosomal protein L32|nr:50S ribosomal protein L32 [Verrucomicrobiae bacterium]